jgi:hypothetical protein
VDMHRVRAGPEYYAEVNSPRLISVFFGPQVDHRIDGLIAQFDIANYADFRKQLLADIVDDRMRARIAIRLAKLDPAQPVTTALGDDADAQSWDRLSIGRAAIQDYQRQLKSVLIELGCVAQDGPYVARGLILSGRVFSVGRHAAEIESRFLERNACPGATDLLEYDKGFLRASVVTAIQREVSPAIGSDVKKSE